MLTSHVTYGARRFRQEPLDYGSRLYQFNTGDAAYRRASTEGGHILSVLGSPASIA